MTKKTLISKIKNLLITYEKCDGVYNCLTKKGWTTETAKVMREVLYFLIMLK